MSVVEKKSEKVYGNFRRFSTMVKTICGLNLALQRKSGINRVKRWTETYFKMRSDETKDLLFNIAVFKRNKNAESEILKTLLSVFPPEREHCNILKIHTLLKKHRAFQRFPESIQLQLCQAAIYQRYEAKRRVLKQSHPPSACYLVLSGRLMVHMKVFSQMRGPALETLNEIEEGDLFGDMCLLQGRHRPATVTCSTDVEVLIINKEDFDCILADFLQVRYNAIYDFFRKLPVFSSWSSEKLDVLVEGSLLRYYRHGTIVISNTSDCNFMVVVKYGRCQLVTHLPMPERTVDNPCDAYKKRDELLLQEFPTLPFLRNKMTQRPSTCSCAFPFHHQTKAQFKVQSNARPKTAVPISRKRDDDMYLINEVQKANSMHLYTLKVQSKKNPAVTASALSSTLSLRVGILEEGNFWLPPEVVGVESNHNMSLISEGTECIFIPHKLFLKEAPRTSVQSAMEVVSSYPTEETIRQNYNRLQAWSAYKSKLSMKKT
ncbi:cyclic nucleotide-binding domain-containing protein 2-like [Erpetoichthys calabaricus]|uniref:cyclic nucleotide-binding domain-containing protein 2-like n=1 Tax=Erpetoichthys calabaricus TaxID=27687 RepID=UPI0022341F6C|nr:cyclic nucleotide-binding domain-containing protein 2-like [Erpetoichthys calabaricus]